MKHVKGIKLKDRYLSVEEEGPEEETDPTEEDPNT